jgi:proteasome assembly chaperone (PAC2) family protein
MVASFRGWNDGAQGASLAVSFLAREWDATQFAEIEPEEFFDFQDVRPHVKLEDGMTRRIDWPENSFHHAAIPGLDRDLVLFQGIEPSLKWQTYTSLVVDLARELGVESIISFGALLADVPHTRETSVTGAGSDEALVEELGLAPSRYEGPTGIVGVLHDFCRDAELPSASIWAAVPHYASLAPSPKAAHALLTKFASFMKIELDLSELEEASEAYQEQVSTAVAADEETAQYVRQLEEQADALEETDIPSGAGDTLAADLSRFLREHDARRREEEDEERS